MSEFQESDGEGPGPPQGSTTGRWELVSNAGKPPERREWKRWSDVPWWYRVLDRFGLPTLFALLLMYGLYRVIIYTLGVVDRQAATFADTMAAQVRATEKLSEQVEQMSADTHAALLIVLERSGGQPMARAVPEPRLVPPPRPKTVKPQTKAWRTPDAD